MTNWCTSDRISSQIQKYIALGKDVVLCCYEDVRIPNEWCHRLLFAEWWESKTGEHISELKNDSQMKQKAEPMVVKPKENVSKIAVGDKPLIKVIYSLWTDTVDDELIYQGGDMYYLVDRETGKLSIMANAEARKLIAEGKAEVWLDYDSIAKIRFVLPKLPVGRAFIATKKGKEKEIAFKDAIRLIETGKANILDIEIE